MPEWIHNRAEHILAKNPSMPKSKAFAIATQQSHSLGKSPKGYGTAAGKREARAKYDTPKDDKKTANPGGLESSKVASDVTDAFAQELAKLASVDDQRLHPKPVPVLSAKPPNPKYGIKQAFAVSQFSGHLSEGPFPQASAIPGWRQPTLKVGGPPGDTQKKTANVISPKGQLSTSQRVGAPKLTTPGPSIAQQSKPRGFGVPMPGLTKAAVVERLVRLGATPIPNTPKLVMKVRSPQQLAELQHSIDRGWGDRVTAPVMRRLGPAVDKLPAGKLRDAAHKGARLVAEDPIGTAVSTVLPVPGSEVVYHGAKKGLERLIDKVAPLPLVE